MLFFRRWPYILVILKASIPVLRDIPAEDKESGNTSGFPASLPGLMCPHYDKVQSNGVLRASDFDKMLVAHSGERGIGLDHFCALVTSDGMYTVLSPEGKEGSVLEDGSHSEERLGRPGLWILEADDDGNVVRTLAPASGGMDDLLS